MDHAVESPGVASDARRAEFCGECFTLVSEWVEFRGQDGRRWQAAEIRTEYRGQRIQCVGRVLEVEGPEPLHCRACQNIARSKFVHRSRIAGRIRDRVDEAQMAQVWTAVAREQCRRYDEVGARAVAASREARGVDIQTRGVRVE